MGRDICKGKGCEFYNKTYVVVEYYGGFLPEFHLTDERCQHPAAYQPVKDKNQDLTNRLNGVFIKTLNKCPLQ